ncbi:MAG: hypothetical protein QXI33_02405 [Candidatus Pacearchaeota archaeon]
MEKSQIWTIVGVSLVVAIITSVATASITGNVIRLNQDRFGKYNVYTTAETYSKVQIDALIKNLSNKATYSGVGEMFGDAKTTGQVWLGISQRDGQPIRITNGHTECGPNSECLIGFGGIVHPNTQYFSYDNEGVLSCDQTLDLNQAESRNDWVNGSKFIVQYLCIDKELLQWADAGFPK